MDTIFDCSLILCIADASPNKNGVFGLVCYVSNALGMDIPRGEVVSTASNNYSY